MPAWIVVGAGTGGTSATIGRYLRYRGLATRLAVVDPQGSAFLPAYAGEAPSAPGSRIEGIGRPRVEPSFVPRVVDRMIGVPDAASVAAMLFLDDRSGLRAGPSTGTNIYGALLLACELRGQGLAGSIVTLMCDRADRYATTFWNAGWLREQAIDPAPYRERLDRAWDTLTGRVSSSAQDAGRPRRRGRLVAIMGGRSRPGWAAGGCRCPARRRPTA